MGIAIIAAITATRLSQATIEAKGPYGVYGITQYFKSTLNDSLRRLEDRIPGLEEKN